MRALLVVIGVVVGCAAGYLVLNLDKQLNAQQAAAAALREQAHALRATIAEVRAGQFAYVAEGQGRAFWMTRVANLLPALEKQTADFSAALMTASAQTALEPALAAVQNIKTLDHRVREYVTTGNALLAGDIIFSDGLESTATATAQINTALDNDLQARLDGLAALRSRQLVIAGAAGTAILLILIVLAFTGATGVKAAEPDLTPVIEPIKFEAPLPRAKPAVTPKLISTAQICGELARVAQTTQLPALLERAARVLDSSGIIVWMADMATNSLRPAMFYGYSDAAIAKMGRIHRDANNGAAAAFRTSELRTVTGDTATSGAIIAPLMTSDGCVGVLSAEMKGGSEKDESSQALATILAAQLATLVAPPAAVPMKAAAHG